MPEKIVAEELAAKQREIGVAEFFARNRHLLGFDNKRKALLTAVKEAVDNSLDACEEARILPEILIETVEMGNERFRIVVEDNGPGIVKKQVPNIFAKLLYGSKFHKLSQSRGQQGIGISAAVMYGQLTTGKPAKILTKIHPTHQAYYCELKIDTKSNKPEILHDEEKEWKKDHGTRVEIDLEATYQKGDQSVDEYLKQTAITNPHATIIYTNPKAEQIIFPRASDKMPPVPKEIKPHPYGVELGVMIAMLKNTPARTLQAFLTREFSRVGSETAKIMCQNAALLPNSKPQALSREQAEQLMSGIQKTKLISPPTDCVVPIGADALEKGLKKEVNAEFYTSVSRTPAVYRGNPFVVECALAYGGQQGSETPISLLRFANRVPLLYQQGGCAITRATVRTNWKSYFLSQSAGALPLGPLTLAVHIASVWVPFTSESKEAIAHYPEIVKEVKLALQEVGRKLALYVSRKKKVHAESAKRDYIEMFIPHVSEALIELIELKKSETGRIKTLLKEILEKKRGKLEDMDFDPDKNVEYDEELAAVGKGEQNDE